MSLKAYMEGSTSRRSAQRKPAPLPRLTAWPEQKPDDDRDERSDLPELSGDDEENRKAGPHWGGYWPKEHVPEWDEVLFEPTRPKHDPGQFRVYSSRGLLIDEFDDRWRAVGALNRWRHADFVIQGDTVIARKVDAAVEIGDVVDAALDAGIARAA